MKDTFTINSVSEGNTSLNSTLKERYGKIKIVAADDQFVNIEVLKN